MTLLEKPLKISAILTLFIVSVCSLGCSSSTNELSPSNTGATEASFEQRVFDLVSDYYCERLAWPQSWTDLAVFEKGRGKEADWLGEASDVTLSSPRAILMSFSFTDKEGTPKKATYIAPPRCGKPAEKGLVSIAAEGVSFKLPDGFELMPAKDIKQRWRSGPYPDAAWNSSDGRLIAVRFGDVEIKQEELNQFSEDMAEAYETSIPSLVWTAKEIRNVGAKQVLYHEFQNTASTGPILNAVLSGVFSERLFAITVSGPSELGDDVLKAARAVERTLRIR
jgi:hypothetical protein